MFSVEPQIATSSSVIQLLVKKPQLLDYETKQEMVIEVSKMNTGHEPVIIILHLLSFCHHICVLKALHQPEAILVVVFLAQMIAIDVDRPSFSSNATITISIQDTNDNSPKFPKDTYELNVTEHSPVGTVIAEITVSTSRSAHNLSLHIRNSGMTLSGAHCFFFFS